MCSRGMSMVVVGVVSLLLFLNNSGGGAGVEAVPFFGLSDLSGNGTSPLALLALAHLQHKADSLSQLSELLALGENFTQSFFTN